MIEKNLTSGNASNGYILGLDLGVGSVGWAKVPFDGGGGADLRRDASNGRSDF